MTDDEIKIPHLYGRQLVDAELAVGAHYFHYPAPPISESPLRPHHFVCVPQLGDLWQLALDAAAKGKRADLSTFVLDDRCRTHFELIDRLSDVGGSRIIAGGIGREEEKIISAAALRLIRGCCMDVCDAILEQTMGVDEAMSALAKAADDARSLRPKLAIPTLKEIIGTQARKIVEAAREGKIIGLPMPLRGMQERLGGWQPGRLHIMCGVTSGHKSTLVRMSLECIAAAGHPSLLISYEDPAGDFANRSIVAANGSEFTTTELMNADFGPKSQRADRLGRFIHEVGIAMNRDIPMYIWDKPMVDEMLISFIYRAVSQYGLKAVGVDFLQLIRSATNARDEVGHLDRLSNRLQLCAKELDIALIVTAQPTQAATTAAVKHNIPIGLGDVKGAAAISQASFGLLALHFPMERVEIESKQNGRRVVDVEWERVPNRILIIPRKWKAGDQQQMMTFACDGAHDTIRDFPIGGGERW